MNRQREAVLKLLIIGDRDRKVAVDAVVDTGFNDDLILPIETVLELDLVPQGYQKATLGDGTISQFCVYAGTVIWDGVRRLVEVNSATTGVLIGMGLLEGYKLEVNAIPNGIVTITNLDS